MTGRSIASGFPSPKAAVPNKTGGPQIISRPVCLTSRLHAVLKFIFEGYASIDICIVEVELQIGDLPTAVPWSIYFA